MNKSSISALGIVAVIVLGGGAFALSNQSKDTTNNKTGVSSSSPNESEAMAVEKKKTEQAAMQKPEAAMSVSGRFSDYDAAKLASAEKGNVVLYFYAPWCPTCKEANKNFTSSKTPDGLTLLKIDYDSAKELKKKYGVTYQHTFVQVDASGKLLKKWNGSTTYDKLLDQII